MFRDFQVIRFSIYNLIRNHSFREFSQEMEKNRVLFSQFYKHVLQRLPLSIEQRLFCLKCLTRLFH